MLLLTYCSERLTFPFKVLLKKPTDPSKENIE